MSQNRLLPAKLSPCRQADLPNVGDESESPVAPAACLGPFFGTKRPRRSGVGSQCPRIQRNTNAIAQASDQRYRRFVTLAAM